MKHFRSNAEWVAHVAATWSLVVAAPTVGQQNPGEPPAELAALVAEADAAAANGGSGPYRAIMLTDPTLATHTVYRPADLEAAARGGALPIVAWGNGACVNFGNRFRYFLTEIASHGYVVLAIGPIGPAWLEWNTQTPGDPNIRPQDREPTSHASQLTDAIEWALTENRRTGSVYEGKLDGSHIAVMGMSCGGLQAISAAVDPRVTTLMVWNSGTFPEGTQPLPGTGEATKATLGKLHTPVAYISGDASDIAFENANADFETITDLPVFRAWHKGIGHSGTYRQPRGGAFTAVAVAWLNWQLRDDHEAGRMFVGADCTLCNDADWVVQRKGW